MRVSQVVLDPGRAFAVELSGGALNWVSLS
jgi:hypothetical protein